MILVDTSVIVAWLDRAHPDHARCEEALFRWSGEDQLTISSVTYAELAAGARTREAMEEDLRIFQRVELDFEAAWRAGLAFGRAYPGRKEPKPVLPDFFIRAQAEALGCRHLTNDRRRLAAFPAVGFVFSEPS
jgi:predicted nucleic acid-binding protein